MKKTYLLAFLLSISFSFAQKNESDLDKIIASEMHTASSLMSVVANPNTLNYDVTYHKLEFTVDPAVALNPVAGVQL